MPEINKSSWSEALRSGDKHYFTGKPCKRGHIALRFTKGGGCVDCNYIRGMRNSRDLDHLTDEQILAARWTIKHKESAITSLKKSATPFTKILNEVFL